MPQGLNKFIITAALIKKIRHLHLRDVVALWVRAQSLAVSLQSCNVGL